MPVRKTILCAVVLLSLITMPTLSQDKSLFINDYLDPFITNPACTGVEGYQVVHLLAEKKWVGFTGSPSTFLLTGNYRIGRYDFYDPHGLLNKGPLKMKDRVGLGAAIFRENYGPLANTGGLLSYAYHLTLHHNSNLSFGMSFMAVRYTLATSMLNPDQLNDDYLLTGNDSRFRANFGAGVYYHTNSYFAGVSVNKLIPGISQVNDQPKEIPSYFVMGGYRFHREKFFSPEISCALKMLDGESMIADFHSKLYIQRSNWLAISYSTIKQFNVQFGVRFYRRFYLGYNYGFTANKMATYNNGSHEISLGINIGLFARDEIQ